MNIISGSALSKEIKTKLKDEINFYIEKGFRQPKLALVLIGENADSAKYVHSKQKNCAELNMIGEIYKMEENTSQNDVINLINKLNNDASVDGILVQLPIPEHLNTEKILLAVDFSKDADGLHPMNAGLLADEHAEILPCTPKGIISLLKYGNVEIKGKHAVVVGRSNLVGKPTAQLLLQENATVTVCHSFTKNLKEIIHQADILVLAIGKPYIVTPDMVKEGAVIVDVAMNWVDDKLGGDIYFDKNLDCLQTKVKSITPVPGGVGPMTICSLLENTFLIYKKNLQIK